MDETIGFPDKRWGTTGGRLGKVMYGFVSTRFGTWFARTAVAPLDRRVLLRSNGRFSLLGPIGAPTMVLTTTGAQSGLPRTCALLYARDGDRLVVAASNFGQQRHPAWSTNLLKNPHAVVGIGGRSVPAHAATLEGDEAAAAYQLLMGVAPMYENYREKTERSIRVFTLTAH